MPAQVLAAAGGRVCGPTAALASRAARAEARQSPSPRAAPQLLVLQRSGEPHGPSASPALALAGPPLTAVAWQALDCASSSGGSSSLYDSTQRMSRHAWSLLEASLLPSSSSSSSSSGGSSRSGSDGAVGPAAATHWASSSHAREAAEAAGPLRVQQLNDPALRQQQPGGGAGPGGGDGGSDDRDPDFFANVGDAIRTLREDYPLLFTKDLNYSIYREDVALKDPNLSFRGLRTYRLIFWGLRLHARLLLSAAHVQVLRIWQPEDAVIKLRWQVNARTRTGQTGTFDGISIYRLDRHGRVYQHEVTDVQLRDPPITQPLLYGLNFILNPRPALQPTPCPGSWYAEGEEGLLPEALGARAAPVPLPLPGSHE